MVALHKRAMKRMELMLLLIKDHPMQPMVVKIGGGFGFITEKNNSRIGDDTNLLDMNPWMDCR